jgi:hypothetical protein
VKDGRWTPQELAAQLPSALGTDRLPMFDYIDAMAKKAKAEAEAG